MRGIVRGVLATVVVVAFVGCDGDGGGGGTGAGGGVSYDLLSPGTAPIEEPMWAITVGSRIGDYAVRSYRLAGEDLVQLVQGDEYQTWRGWLKETEQGLLEVGDVRDWVYPKARMLLPAEPLLGMSWFTSPWARADDRVVKLGENPEGDSPAHNGETATLEPFATSAPWGEGRQMYTIFGWRDVYLRTSDLDGGGGMTWIEGVGPAPVATVPDGEHGWDAVVLDEPMPRPDPGPTVKLEPALDGSIMAECFRPSGLDVLTLPDGSLQVVLSGDGLVNKIMSSDMGSQGVYLAEPIDFCWTYRDGAFAEQPQGEACRYPTTNFVRSDGTLVKLPEKRVEYHDMYGNITDVAFVPMGAIVEQGGRLIHLCSERLDAWDSPSVGVNEGRVVTWSNGDSVPAGVWRHQLADDGSQVFRVGRELSVWDEEGALGDPVKGPLPTRWHLYNSAAGEELYHVTADGRLREVSLQPDGVRYRPLAQLDLPDEHVARAAVRLEGDRFLVFTHTGDVGYGPQWYHEKEIGYDVMEWRIEAEWVKPDFGEGHLWFAEIPLSDPAPQLPPIADVVTITPVDRNLEVCWPSAYGPPETEGWTLAGHEPYAVLADEERNCLLIVRHPARVAPVRLPGAFWAEGPLPTVGNVRLGTTTEGSDDGWNGAAWIDPIRPPDGIERVSSANIFWDDLADPWGPSFPAAGVNPRAEMDRGGLYYAGNQPLEIVDPEHPSEGPPYYTGAYMRLGADGVETYAPGGIDHDGSYREVYDLGPHELIDKLESTGVQGGGILFQDTVTSYWDYTDENTGYGRGMNRFIDPPALPTPETPWRHEAMLMDRTLCGHLGSDTLYCIDADGQRELTGVTHLSERQWWVTDVAPEPENGVCPANFETVDCPNGRIWLLGADEDHSVVSLFDPAAMEVTDFVLVDLLPELPATPDQLRLDVFHRVVPYSMRKEAFQSPYGLVSATTPDGPRFWMLRFGPDEPTLVWGPRRLEIPADVHWGAHVMAEVLPRLRPLQETDNAYFALDEVRVVSLVLGDVTDFVVDAVSEPAE